MFEDEEDGFLEAVRNIRATMRVGRKLGRTLYLHLPDQDPDEDMFIGVMDLKELADEMCRRWNAALP